MTKEKDPYLEEDLREIVAENEIDWEALAGCSVLVTGSTGLIGSLLVKALCMANQTLAFCKEKPIRVLALIRSRKKAEEVFGPLYTEEVFSCVVADLMQEEFAVEGEVDYILHAAAQTASKEMVEHPVETIRTAVKGTEHLLALAAQKKVRGMVYLSSMEVYGSFLDGRRVIEEMSGYVDPLAVRSNYPLAKRLCENLCVAYHQEYGVPVRIARLAQTFGAGVLPTDHRVFAQFARSVMEKKDIVLHTHGQSEGNYCYTTDTVRALLMLLTKGKPGEAYNIANEEMHRKIADLAEFAAGTLAEGRIRVVYEIPEGNSFGYAADTRMCLDASRMRELSWEPKHGLEDSFRRLIASLAVRG